MGYVHKIYGYRYNWHNDMYEIDIVLKGTLEFFRDGTKHILHTDDMIVVNPGVGHASYPLEPDTQALVLRLSSRALNDFTSRKHLREFSFASNEENRNSQSCRLLRYYAAQIVRALRNGCTKPVNRNLARSCLGSPMRQSRMKIRRMLHNGAAIFDGSSGIKCAIESSSFATLSTIRFLKVPVGVSSITPIGTFAIRSVIASRIFFKIVKEILWDIREERHVRSIFII